MPFQKLKFAAVAAAVLGAVVAMPAQAGKTLDAIKARGQIICGVHTGLPGFSAADSNGKWVGLDVDICRAVAAAALGDAGKVKFVPLTAQARFTALQSGEIDIRVGLGIRWEYLHGLFASQIVTGLLVLNLEMLSCYINHVSCIVLRINL